MPERCRPVGHGRLRIRPLVLLLASVVLPRGARVAQTLPPISEQTHRAFAETDRNGDGRIDREEFHRRILVIEEIANVRPEAFRAADRNGDGKLSLEEYVNARFKDFEAIDANGDGVITKDELDR